MLCAHISNVSLQRATGKRRYIKPELLVRCHRYLHSYQGSLTMLLRAVVMVMSVVYGK